MITNFDTSVVAGPAAGKTDGGGNWGIWAFLGLVAAVGTYLYIQSQKDEEKEPEK